MSVASLLSAVLFVGPPLVGPEHREAVRADRAHDRATRWELRRQRPLLWRSLRRYQLFDLKFRESVLERRLEELEGEVANARVNGAHPTQLAELERRLARVQAMLAETAAERAAGLRIRKALFRNFADTQDTKNFRLTPLLGPAYTPEQGFLIGGGLQLSWSSDRIDPDLPRSNVPVLFAINSRGGYGIESRLQTYWLDDRLRWNLDLRAGNTEDHYWGVGFQNARTPRLFGPTTRYRRLSWQANPAVMVRPWKRFYVGPLADFNRTIVREPSARVARDAAVRRFGRDNYNAGIGFRVAWDNRDVPVNAYRGVYVALSGTFYEPSLGSDNRYQLLELDYRQYQTVIRRGSTIAWQVRARHTFGDAPYAELSQLGGPRDLRGYYKGRYRDALTTTALVEYRYMFRRGRPASEGRPLELSRHGFVVWAGVGGLGPEFAELVHWLPNTGFGYRFEVQPRINIRADLGFGEDTVGFYFNFLESF